MLEPSDGSLGGALGDPEDELDAFNDDTFGVGAEEWQEDDHEALALMTEEQRKAMEDANDFFEFGDDGGSGEELGGELEPIEANGNGAASKDEMEMQREFEEMQLREQRQRQQQQPQARLQDDPAVINAVPPPQVQQMPPTGMMPAMPPMPAAAQLPPGADPAIMSVGGKLPAPNLGPGGHFVITQTGGPPPMQPVLPPSMLPQPPQFPSGMMGPPPRGQPKTLEELEREMMMAPPPPPQMQQQQQRPPPQQQHMNMPPQQMHQHHQHHQQQMHHHHQQQQMHQYHMQQQQQQQQFRRPPNHHHQHQQHHHQFQHQQHHHHHHQQPGSPHHQHHHRGGYNQQHQGHRNFNNNNNNRNSFDDKNRETFGDDLVDEQQREHRQEREQHGRHRQQHRGSHNPARRDLMPGHVHTLGILRDARERESTGNPNLDLELEKRDAEEAELRASYQTRNNDDEFAGLMTPRERQWIINIQLQSLKCENPFIDDYYFTVFNQKKEMAAEEKEKEAEMREKELEGTYQPKRTEEGPQLLLQAESSDPALSKDSAYKPQQFSNSLGKLQAANVKAPRKIIDVGIVINESGDGQSAETKSSRHFKSTLMELERLYTTLIDVEDCDKKLAALPTGTAMHDQVMGDRATALRAFCAALTVDGKIRRYLLVRKGKVLLKRCLRVVGEAEVQLFAGTLFAILPLAMKRDKEDGLVPRFWQNLLVHVSSSNVDLLTQYLRLLSNGGSSSSSCTFKFCLANPFGLSVLLLLLRSLLPLHADLSSEGRSEAERLLEELANAVSEAGDLPEPMFALGGVLPPVKGTSGSTLEDRKEIGRLVILSQMKKEKNAAS